MKTLFTGCYFCYLIAVNNFFLVSDIFHGNQALIAS